MNTKKDNYIRWQNIRINQLGFANNLIIALATALIGYILNFLQLENTDLNIVQKVLFWIGSGLIIISIGLGIFVVINRLEDFRLTAQIAKNKDFKDLEEDRDKTKKLGKRTWCAFIWQTSTFLIGFLLLLIMTLIELSNKIT
jgi:hypothetical protein